MSPFRSKAQQKYLAVHSEKIGGWKKFLQWAHETPDIKRLPEKAPKKKEDK
jgi:hypothetical protein